MDTLKLTLVDMFNAVLGKKNFPKIVVPHQNGEIVFSLAAKHIDTHFPNLIYIKYRTAKQPVDAYLGAITKTNELSLNFRSSPQCDTTILAETVKSLHKDPLDTLKIVGQDYSYCCFCGTYIVSKHSLKVGYGPICAGNYGLPWGEEEPEELGDL